MILQSLLQLHDASLNVYKLDHGVNNVDFRMQLRALDHTLAQKWQNGSTCHVSSIKLDTHLQTILKQMKNYANELFQRDYAASFVAHNTMVNQLEMLMGLWLRQNKSKS